MAKVKFEAEIEVCIVYGVPIWAESMEEAAEKAKSITRLQAEEGEQQDHETNVAGVRRDKGRMMYQ